MNNKSKVESLLGLFFVSGFSGLIYESVWSHYVKLFLGHAAYAQTLVLVVFIGGLALGAWLCSRLADRLRNPLLLYAVVEVATGILGLAFHWVFNGVIDWGYATLLPAACDVSQPFCVAQWGLSALLLAPQSILLGMTFPLMSSAVLRLHRADAGHDIASLYFLNSLGAVLGVLASAFVLIPAVGLPGTLMTAGIANILIAVAAFFLSRTPQPALEAAPGVAPRPNEASAKTLLIVLLATAGLTGLSSFIYEIVWIRMLSLVLGASTHSFELMLATFILGLALGGLWIRGRVDRIADPVRFLAIVQVAMGICAAATIPLYNGTFDLMAWMLSSVSRSPGGFVIFSLTSMAIALLVMLPATFCAGMTLPLITYRLLRSSSGERSLGLVYAVNTLGSIVGVVVAVHLLLGWLGLHGSLVVGASIDVLLGVFLLLYFGRGLGRRSWAPALGGLVALVVVAVVFDIDARRAPSGVFRSGVARLGASEKVVYHRDGKTATVDVIESGRYRMISTNGKSDASVMMGDGPLSRDEYTMLLLGLLPLAHQPQARSAAVIGFGSGMTTTTLLASPALQRVDTVEIEPSMVEGARQFLPIVAPAFQDPRSHIVIDDAKSYFARGQARYDIIVSEPSNPWVSGVSSLFTEEFYQRLSTYLNEGGVLSQWLHTYEMDNETLASILAAVSKTFPDFVVYSSIDQDIVLIARKGGVPGAYDTRVNALPALQSRLERLHLRDPDIVRRRVIGRWSTLQPYMATVSTRANSDYFPIVDQRTSRTRFTQESANDFALLQSATMPLLEMVDPDVYVPVRRLDPIPVTYVDHATIDAWLFHDNLVTGVSRSNEALSPGSAEAWARMLRSWEKECPADLPFGRMVPMIAGSAERVNTRLATPIAMDIWVALATSPCAQRLKPEELVWFELFAAVAQRDAPRMAQFGVTVLRGFSGDADNASEYAVFAAATGLLCTAHPGEAKALLDAAKDKWLRKEQRSADRRFLYAMARRGPMACPVKLAATKPISAPPPSPAPAVAAKRSP